MTKIDLKKDLKYLYQPSAKEVVQVDVPAMNFLMIDGEGDPNTSPAYQAAVEALFSVAYAIKFKVKKTLAIDYGVMPLEGLWWADDMATFLASSDKSGWKWTMMICSPSSSTPHGARHHRRGAEKEGAARARPIAFRPLPEGRARRSCTSARSLPRVPPSPRSRLYRHGGQALRQAPRDLPLRHPQGRPGQVEDHHPPAATRLGRGRRRRSSPGRTVPRQRPARASLPARRDESARAEEAVRIGWERVPRFSTPPLPHGKDRRWAAARRAAMAR